MIKKFIMLIAVSVTLLSFGCSSEDDAVDTTDTASGTSSKKGSVNVSITDAPANGFDHVWITVRDIWFNKSEDAGPMTSGWIKFPLSSAITIDLLDLSNGTVSAPVWENIELPVGDYTQIRIFLAGTEAALTTSASDAGLQYNNQVDVTGDGTSYPLRVPDAMNGIRLTGEFSVKENGKLKLAIDFDAGNDVIEITQNGKTEYILKPKLTYFDLANAGAIVGRIDSSAADNNLDARFVFKAEQVNEEATAHVVRRAAIANQDGTFVLYPLAPGSYDLVIRGLDYKTVIVKEIPVISGTTPTLNPTSVPEIGMTPAETQDYTVSASIAAPTGAWVTFMQTLPGDGEVPYEIRFRHFNPLTGTFAHFPLSSDDFRTGTYDATGITLSAAIPVEGNGGYKAAAFSRMYEPSPYVTVTAENNCVSFDALSVKAPAVARSVSGSIVIPEDMANTLDKGTLFAVHGGMVVHAVNIDSLMPAGGEYKIENLPGGSSETPLIGAIYGLDALGLSSSLPGTKAKAWAGPADLSSGAATGIDLEMTMLP